MVTEALLVGILFIIVLLACRRPSGLPPGIWGLPVVGVLPSSTECLGDQVLKLRKVYGDIITWRMGCRINVFLCDFDIIKNALKRPEMSNRPDFYTYTIIGQGQPLGILLGNGSHWTKNRRFVIRHMRDLGMGKTIMEETIQEEAKSLVQEFKKHTGKDQPLPLSMGVAVLNMVWTLVANTRYKLDDPKAQEFIELTTSVNDNLQGPIFFFNIFPWLLTFAPTFLKKKLGYYDLNNVVNETNQVVTKFIKEHEAALDQNNPKDLIDYYLIEMQQNKDQDTTMSEKDLTAMLIELFVAGVDTTTTSLRWAFLYLAKYPQIQARLQKDIDSQIPKDGSVFYHERTKLPYLEAVIHELQRIVSLAPMAVAHTASEHTQLEGYFIPKGTVIVPYLESCHKDPKLWSHPDSFNPDRFLNEDGSFNTKKGYAAFGIGKRSCAGESLAKVELFVFLTALLRNFTFELPPGEEGNTEKDPSVLIINAPKPYNIRFSERE